MSLVERKGLHVVNAMDICQGSITRHRETKVGTEKAILDYIIVCDRLLPFVSEMVIDEQREDVLTKYATKKGTKTKVESDHNLLRCQFKIKYDKSKKKERIEIFKYKDQSGQKKFLEVTTNTNKLSSCFDNDLNIKDQSVKFEKALRKISHECFTKVKTGGRIKETEIGKKIKVRDKLISSINNNTSNQNKTLLKTT